MFVHNGAETLYTSMYMYVHVCIHINWRVGTSQPSRTTGTIFLYKCIYQRCLSDPVYKMQYFICDTRGPTRNSGKNTT